VREETSEPKRGRFDICADILRSLDSRVACRKGTLAKMSNLDSRALSQYLDLLLRYELALGARNRHAEYTISEKGKKYLNAYAHLLEIL
jgi:predicted transcriptional regulator